MDIIEFFRHEQKRLHQWMREAVSDLTTQEWNTLPTGNGNNIAFLLWHSVRTEDNILHFILQGRALSSRGHGQAVGRNARGPGHRSGLYLASLYTLWRNIPDSRPIRQKGYINLNEKQPARKFGEFSGWLLLI